MTSGFRWSTSNFDDASRLIPFFEHRTFCSLLRFIVEEQALQLDDKRNSIVVLVLGFDVSDDVPHPGDSVDRHRAWSQCRSTEWLRQLLGNPSPRVVECPSSRSPSRCEPSKEIAANNLKTNQTLSLNICKLSFPQVFPKSEDQTQNSSHKIRRNRKQFRRKIKLQAQSFLKDSSKKNQDKKSMKLKEKLGSTSTARLTPH